MLENIEITYFKKIYLKEEEEFCILILRNINSMISLFCKCTKTNFLKYLFIALI